MNRPTGIQVELSGGSHSNAGVSVCTVTLRLCMLSLLMRSELHGRLRLHGSCMPGAGRQRVPHLRNGRHVQQKRYTLAANVGHAAQSSRGRHGQNRCHSKLIRYAKRVAVKKVDAVVFTDSAIKGQAVQLHSNPNKKATQEDFDRMYGDMVRGHQWAPAGAESRDGIASRMLLGAAGEGGIGPQGGALTPGGRAMSALGSDVRDLLADDPDEDEAAGAAADDGDAITEPEVPGGNDRENDSGKPTRNPRRRLGLRGTTRSLQRWPRTVSGSRRLRPPSLRRRSRWAKCWSP